MNRSVIAYPLTRGMDAESGGAADLQTDIMRFMAILSLCLVAIFALVQSIPLTPEPQMASPIDAPADAAVMKTQEPAQEPAQIPVQKSAQKPAQKPAPQPAIPATRAATPAVTEAPVTPRRPAPAAQQVPLALQAPAATAAAASNDKQGFTLRFESDLALTRLVAAKQVSFFAIAPTRARRMAVANSLVSFWDASMPDSFHEMEASTVPRPVVDALVRTGADAESVKWGVTLPGRLSAQLATMMREHNGGALVIGSDGSLALDES